MASLRSLLARTDVHLDKDIVEQFTKEITEVLSSLNRPGLHNNFRDDVIKVISTAVDMGKTLSSPTFEVDEVLRNLSFLNARMAMILDYVSSSRPRTQGYGLVHAKTGRIAPTIYLDKSEADRYVENLRELGMLPPDIELRRIEVVSSSVQAPATPASAAATPPRPPVPTPPDNGRTPVFEAHQLDNLGPIPDPGTETEFLPQIVKRIAEEQAAAKEPIHPEQNALLQIVALTTEPKEPTNGSNNEPVDVKRTPRYRGPTASTPGDPTRG